MGQQTKYDIGDLVYGAHAVDSGYFARVEATIHCFKIGKITIDEYGVRYTPEYDSKEDGPYSYHESDVFRTYEEAYGCVSEQMRDAGGQVEPQKRPEF